MKALQLLLLAGLLASVSSPSAWAVNKCTAKDGKVVYQDVPCQLPPGARSPDPVATGRAPRGDGELTPDERRAIVDRMNAEVEAGIVKMDQERYREAQREARERTTEAARQKPTTTSQPMDFEPCRLFVARSLLAFAGTTRTYAIVNSSALTVHKICTNDGSVILTCSAADGRLSTTASPYACP